MNINGTNAELTYCLNVHPGATPEELETAVFRNAKEVFRHFADLTGQAGPFGLGIWLSAVTAAAFKNMELVRDLRARLADHNFYVSTVNGFPYGAFHGTRVKQEVYRPDWATPEREQHTLLLARILAELLGDRDFGTISTVPITYGEWADTSTLSGATRNLARLAMALDRLQQETGKQIHIDLEPEPDCYLEDSRTILEFQDRYVENVGYPQLSKYFAGDEDRARRVWHEHIGYCLDLIHLAVVFERPAEAIVRLRNRNIPVPKMHLGAAIRNRKSGPPPKGLADFIDATYLHQTRIRNAQGLHVFADLPEALASAIAGDWRVHYHVPLIWEGTPELESTRDQLDQACFQEALKAGTRHFEVETYTLSLFPDKTEPDELILARELTWAWQQLSRAAGTIHS